MESVIQLIHNINRFIINPIIVLLFAVAVLVFIYGIFEYFRNGNSSEGRDTGRRHMIAGVIGIAIMVSVFGIIDVVINTIGANKTSTGINEVIR